MGGFDKGLIGALTVIGILGLFGVVFVGYLFGGEGPAEGSTDGMIDVEGNVEFWITHYDPAKGGINGHDCGGAAGKICSDPASPTGYKFTGAGATDTGAIAVPQDSKYHKRGRADINQIPVPLVHSKVKDQAKIAIPGYNMGKATVIGDHFATTITKPNRLDLACSASRYNQMKAYWVKNKLILDTGKGVNGGAKIMSKVEGTVIR